MGHVAQILIVNANLIKTIKGLIYFRRKKECFKKWLAVMTREEFVPTKHSRIYGDHITSPDNYPSSCMLLKTLIPSGFDLPQLLEKVVTARRQLKRKSPHVEGDCK